MCGTRNKTLPKTYDFKTMYTSIPHNSLKKRMAQVIKEAYQYKADKFSVPTDSVGIIPVKVGQKWTNMSGGMTETDLIEAVEFLIDNTYIKNGNQIRRQMVGIPMGGSASGEQADLYCYAVESEWMDSQHPEDTHTKHDALKEIKNSHRNTARFIDDALTEDEMPPGDLYEME